MSLIRNLLSHSRGMLYALTGVFILAVTDNMVVLFAEDWGIWQLLFVRALVLIPIIAVLFFYGIIKLKATSWFFVILRNALLTIAIVLFYTSLATMNVAIAGAGFFTHPIFLWFLSFLFLSTGVSLVLLVAVAFGLVGAWLIINPFSVDFQWVYLLTILSGFLYALSSFVLSQRCQKESTMLLMFVYTVITLIVGAFGLGVVELISFEDSLIRQYPFLLTSWQPLNGKYLFLVLIQAILSSIAVILITKAYQIANEPSTIAVIEYFYLLFAGGMAYFIWGQTVTPQGVVGMVCICFAGICIVQLKRQKATSVHDEP